jgi:hypothetical protein
MHPKVGALLVARRVPLWKFTMRHHVATLAVFTVLGLPGPAWAQRFIIIPDYGAGYEAVVVAELPQKVRAAVREQLKCEPKVAFVFWRCYVFQPGFDFWTSDGKFALYDAGQYWELPEAALANLLGPAGMERLSTPWRYWIPPGLATCLGILAAAFVIGYRSSQMRAQRLLKDETHRLAFQAYLDNLPSDSLPTAEDKARAFAEGIALLVRSGIPEEQGEPSLRLLVSEWEREKSHELRNLAVVHEEAGEWEDAAELYALAARLRVQDPDDHAFLLQCIERVRGKQQRSC